MLCVNIDLQLCNLLFIFLKLSFAELVLNFNVDKFLNPFLYG